MSIAAQVSEPQVVGEQEDKVRRCRRGDREKRAEQEQRNDALHAAFACPPDLLLARKLWTEETTGTNPSPEYDVMCDEEM